MPAELEALSHRRRAARACLSCRTRKLRCDVSTHGAPCTKCREFDVACKTVPRKTRVSKKAQNANFALAVAVAKSDEPLSSQGPQPPTPENERPPSSTSTTRLSTNEIEEIREAISSQSQPRRKSQNPLRKANGVSSSFTATELMSFSSSFNAIHSVPHYPFLDSIHASAGENVDALQEKLLQLGVKAGSQEASTCGHKELDYLNKIGAFELPDEKIVLKCVDIYFDTFHPFFPIIDKSSVLDSIRTSYPGPSHLLLQAMMMVACAHISSDLLNAAGFLDRKHARHHFYLRARRLYEMDHENDSITNIQALLLISQYYPSLTERKHTWHWIHQAISLAQQSGLHRHPGDTPYRAMWARIWWACVVRDRCNGLGTGRPLMINSLDCSVPLLSIEDISEDGDNYEDRVVKTMFIEFTKLCLRIEGVLSLQYSTPSDAASEQFKICAESLQQWLSFLPPETRINDHDLTRGGNVTLYKCLLHAAYNTLRINLCQSHLLWNLPNLDEIRYHAEMQTAALENTQYFLAIENLGLTSYCPTIAVTFTLAPLVVHVLNLRASINEETRFMHRSRFNACIQFLHSLNRAYWHAGFYERFFELARETAQKNATGAWGSNQPLNTFLNQPISLGHLLVLQRYQQEAQAHSQRADAEAQLNRDEGSLNPSPQNSRDPSDVTMTHSEHLDIDEWLKLNYRIGSVVPFA